MDRVAVVGELLPDDSARRNAALKPTLKVLTHPQVQQVARNESRAQAAQLLGIVVTGRAKP